MPCPPATGITPSPDAPRTAGPPAALIVHIARVRAAEQYRGSLMLADLELALNEAWLPDFTVAIERFAAENSLDSAAVQLAVSALPAFMKPKAVIRLGSLPKDGGVGKVRRRELAHAEALDVLEL